METTERPVIRIVELVDEQSIIERRTFEDSVIQGPAVLALLDSVTISDSGFSGAPDSIFIEIPEGKFIQGVIGLRHVTFRRCSFQNIGIVGTSDSIQAFTKGFLRMAPDPRE